ncbi:succinate dehydrogenase assembly factor 2 [Chelativorans alearense]|uniref:FAD assembly factor SdhE n=1 Tax=Chelativorans alearense TaxID=2681495 RepID=UPI0013D176FB|nr:succinate dehydrogenase assembly factor 2 [Chelativorans alearense]
MTGTTRSSADLEPRRRRALVRAWRRGMREMDLVLGGFADRHIGALSDAELEAFEALLEVPDNTLLTWVTGEKTVPTPYDTDLFARLRASCAVPPTT